MEWAGRGLVALNSKTYYCYGGDGADEVKFSAKGINRGVNDITAEMYLTVLRDRTVKSFVNRGFINPHEKRSKAIHTYEMERNGLSWFYGKRQIQADGVSTIPLNI